MPGTIISAVFAPVCVEGYKNLQRSGLNRSRRSSANQSKTDIYETSRTPQV